MIHLDTSALIAALTGARTAAPVLRAFIRDGFRVAISTPVLYEWERGPRNAEERDAREILFPNGTVFDFGLDDALLAAELYRRMARPRGREIDIAIAACALASGAALWTLNPTDFADIPGLTLAT